MAPPPEIGPLLPELLKKPPDVIAAAQELYTPVASLSPAQKYPWEGLSTAAERFAWALPLKDSYNLTNDYLRTLAKGIVDPKYEWMNKNADTIIKTGPVR